MHLRFSYLSFFVKTTIEYALENIDPDILHMDLRVFLEAHICYLIKIKANMNNVLLIVVIIKYL